MDTRERSCVDCGMAKCKTADENYTSFCMTARMDPQRLSEAMAEYEEEENRRVAVVAAEVEGEFYGRMTRVEEICEFAKRMGMKKIGIATCVGLLAEARTAGQIFRTHGFEVFGIGCKAGSQLKTSIGIPKRCTAIGDRMCNPILQAQLLNEAGTELNVVIGLCVGHDSLFYKYAKGLTTTLVTKDRVLGNNPAAALYLTGSYYKRLLQPEK